MLHVKISAPKSDQTKNNKIINNRTWIVLQIAVRQSKQTRGEAVKKKIPGRRSDDNWHVSVKKYLCERFSMYVRECGYLRKSCKLTVRLIDRRSEPEQQQQQQQLLR